MKGERSAPLAAAISAVVSILCCLPVGIPAAIGVAGLGTLAGDLQPWLMALAAALLVFGAVQFWRNRSCRRRSRLTIAVLCVSGAIVGALLVFPQTLAGIAADWTPGGRSAPSLTQLDGAAFARLKDDFNRHADSARLIVLLSPT